MPHHGLPRSSGRDDGRGRPSYEQPGRAGVDRLNCVPLAGPVLACIVVEDQVRVRPIVEQTLPDCLLSNTRTPYFLRTLIVCDTLSEFPVASDNVTVSERVVAFSPAPFVENLMPRRNT